MVLRASPHKVEEKERTRSTLLRAALELAAAHGFASLGLREVARAASIAPTSFYRHFADMNDVGRALVDEHVAPMLRDLASDVREGDPLATATALTQGMLTAVEAQPELVRFLIAERAGAFPALRAALSEKLALLALSLQPVARGSQRSLMAESAVALLLDGCTRALDLAEPERGPERERLIAVLRAVLGHA